MRKMAREEGEEALDERPFIGLARRPEIWPTTDDVGQSLECVVGQMRLGVVASKPVPTGIRGLRDHSRWHAAVRSIG